MSNFKEYCKKMNLLEDDSKTMPDLFTTNRTDYQKKHWISSFIANILFLSVKGDIEKAAKELKEDPELIRISNDIAKLSKEMSDKITQKYNR